MENKVEDLSVLERYLTADELKEVAKQVAYNCFANNLSRSNPHAKTNLEFYIGQGALNAVLQYGEELDFDFHAKELKEKVSKLIQKLSDYSLPTTYQELAKEYVLENKEVIENKMKSLLETYINGTTWDSAYTTFEQKIGETMADLLYGMLEEKFKR